MRLTAKEIYELWGRCELSACLHLLGDIHATNQGWWTGRLKYSPAGQFVTLTEEVAVPKAEQERELPYGQTSNIGWIVDRMSTIRWVFHANMRMLFGGLHTTAVYACREYGGQSVMLLTTILPMEPNCNLGS